MPTGLLAETEKSTGLETRAELYGIRRNLGELGLARDGEEHELELRAHKVLGL
jgi:hypothetical protein